MTDLFKWTSNQTTLSGYGIHFSTTTNNKIFNMPDCLITEIIQYIFTKQQCQIIIPTLILTQSQISKSLTHQTA